MPLTQRAKPATPTTTVNGPPLTWMSAPRNQPYAKKRSPTRLAIASSARPTTAIDRANPRVAAVRKWSTSHDLTRRHVQSNVVSAASLAVAVSDNDARDRWFGGGAEFDVREKSHDFRVGGHAVEDGQWRGGP